MKYSRYFNFVPSKQPHLLRRRRGTDARPVDSELHQFGSSSTTRRPQAHKTTEPREFGVEAQGSIIHPVRPSPAEMLCSWGRPRRTQCTGAKMHPRKHVYLVAKASFPKSIDAMVRRMLKPDWRSRRHSAAASCDSRSEAHERRHPKVVWIRCAKITLWIDQATRGKDDDFEERCDCGCKIGRHTEDKQRSPT